jgi:hypothetical protein
MAGGLGYTWDRLIGGKMPKSFDIRALIKTREAHGKEVRALETAIREAVNNAVDGMKIETVCLGENKDDSFNFTIWGKLVVE